jgi:hypothetical protein
MGGKLTIRIVCIPVVLSSCVFITGAACGQAVEKGGAASRFPDAPGVEIQTHQSSILDTVSSWNLPARNSVAPNSATSNSATSNSVASVSTQTQLRAALHAARRPVTEAGPQGFNRPSEFDSNRDDQFTDPNEFWAKRLPPAAHSVSHSHLSDSGSFFGRATHAASGIALMRDDAGEARLNTTYFLRVLASAVAHSASRPYWKRSLSQPFSDFGATIGNDAGMNVLHEFSPGIMQAMRNHQPRFVSHIGQRFHHN